RVLARRLETCAVHANEAIFDTLIAKDLKTWLLLAVMYSHYPTPATNTRSREGPSQPENFTSSFNALECSNKFPCKTLINQDIHRVLATAV
ncbi:hypothetical protein Ancab_009996, partial [Ancistrocladus abbreviatus]